MRYIASTQLKSGMVIGQDIFDGTGRMVMSKRHMLDSKNIAEILRMGIAGLYIDDAFTRGIEIQEIVAPEVRRCALESVHNMFAKASDEPTTEDEKRIQKTVGDVVEQILENGDVMYNMLEVKDYDNYTYFHSVNVGILSSLIGIQMGLSKDALVELTTAAMLHDIGKTFVDSSLLSARRKLRDEEWLEMRRHPMYGYEYVRENYNFPVSVGSAILEHHENWDGTGYPMGLKGADIHLYARIIKAADVYDGMTSARPYHDAMLPGEVIEYIMAHVGTEFDVQVVTVMLEKLCVYPVGCEVILSNGEHAIVVKNHNGYILRPSIKLLGNGKVIDLMSDKDARNLTIVKLIL